MNVAQFIAKWRRVQLSERSASQQHFLDLCELLGHEKPAAADPEGVHFTFERGARKIGGEDGWADVWKRGFFGWEYKGRHKDLDAAYKQLLDYREALESPPLLVVCDMDRIVVHTNFTNTPGRVYEIPLEQLGGPRNLEILRQLFFEPDKLKPGATSAVVTEEAARHLAEIAQSLRGRGLDPIAVARFLDRLVFCMFAEDIGLLPPRLFGRMVENSRQDAPRFTRQVKQLFAAMATGGDFGADEIRHFDGNLFADADALELTEPEIAIVHKAALLDWSSVEPSIFGTLFERGLDPDKRSQIGAHYTSRQDIETLVEPVVMQPLRREWESTKTLVSNLLATGKKFPSGGEKPPTRGALRKAHDEADMLLQRFMGSLAQVKVLDPACGSGNFLYVTLQKLKDLEKEVSTFASEQGFGGLLPLVGPWQLYGIEINPYAFELAQMTVWIGYIQWTKFNGFEVAERPVLKPLDTFRCMDAILDLSDPEHPREPDWPKVDFIVSNPPFLGGKLMRNGLGDDYVNQLFEVWQGRVPHEADLCCYWFEKAREHIEKGKCRRAGLLATQGIRGGANRKVLERIKQTGDLFFAESDRPWILDGANVHVSIVGFDDGTETLRVLDGRTVPSINTNLSATSDVTRARRLAENCGLSIQGDNKVGKFELEEAIALHRLLRPNPNGRPNSDVIRTWANGQLVTQRKGKSWIVDFPPAMTLETAAQYEAPFEFVEASVYPERSVNRRAARARLWWLHGDPQKAMRHGVEPLPRFIVTPRVAKYRFFVWFDAPRLADCQLFVFFRCDDYFLGVLHSRVHEVWARAQGTQLRERESGFRYTPTTCFETFPFPWPPGREPADDPRVHAIAEAARELNDLRERWLNPPEWVREEVLEFPGSVDGPWARHVRDPDARGIGTVRYPRLVPRDAECAANLKRRTLTNLYNLRPTWLALAHEKLDAAVFAAYGWDTSTSDEELLEALLTLNLRRAEGEETR